MQWRSGKAAGLTACKQQAERQSKALKFSLIPLKEGVWGIKGKKKKKSFLWTRQGQRILQKIE